MDILDEFIEWYFGMYEADTITCPHCNAEVEQDQLQEDGFKVICPNCDGKISKEDFVI